MDKPMAGELFYLEGGTSVKDDCPLLAVRYGFIFSFSFYKINK